MTTLFLTTLFLIIALLLYKNKNTKSYDTASKGSLMTVVMNPLRTIVDRMKGHGKCADYVLAKGMNNLSVGVYTKRLGEKEEYVFVNPVIRTFYGCEDMTQSPYWNQQEEDRFDLKVIESHETVSYDKVMCDENGVPQRWFNVTKMMQSMGYRGEYIMTTVTDISEQKKREIELEEAKIHLGIAMSATDLSVWRYNLKEKRFYSVHGEIGFPMDYTVSEFIARIHPDSLERCVEVYHKLLSQESKSEEVIFRLLDPKTDTYRYIESILTPSCSPTGVIENMIGTYKDITAAQCEQIALQDMHNSLDMAIKAGDIVAWEYNLMNEKFRILYGRDDHAETETNKLSNEETTRSYLHETEIERYYTFISDVIRRGAKDSIIVRGIDLAEGTSTYFDIMVSALKDKQGNVVKLLGIRKNITESENRRINLVNAQKNLALAMEAGGVSVWLYDIAKKTFFTLQGNTIAGNGLTMEDNLTLLHPDDAIVCRELTEAMAKGEKMEASVIYRYKADDIEGGYRYYEAKQIAITENGAITCLTGTQKEVTNEHFYNKRLEESNLKAQRAVADLQQLNRYNRLILDNSNSGLVYLTPDHRVRWENVSTQRISNHFMKRYKKGAVCYRDVKGLDAPCEHCIMDQAIRTRKNASEELCLDNGEIIDVCAIPARNEDGTVDGVVLRMDDVTQQKRSYNELQIAKEKAEQSDRFKSTFLANMSHEIRTPLNAIVGFSELVCEVESPTEKQEYCKIIAQNNELLLKLINDILDLSKMEAGFIGIKEVHFDLVELYHELFATFQQRMSPGVQLICENPMQECLVYLDKNRLTQVITNFVTNAMKFTETGYIKIGYDWLDQGLKIYVTDTGIGIPPEKLNAVFDRFEKLNPFIQGTGLGLSICKSIVEAGNGTIGVDSTVGKGSTFWAMIPCKILHITDEQHQG